METCVHEYFLEPRQGELRRIYLPRIPVNKIRRQGPNLPCCHSRLAFLSQRTLIEHRNDLAGEAPDRLLVIGLARDRDDEVVDPRIDHRLEPFSYHLWRPSYGLISIFLV